MSDAPEFVRPFANGSEYYSWIARNCDRCALNGYEIEGVEECGLEYALSMGTITGTIHVDAAELLGATVRGEYCDMPRQCAAFKDRDTRDDDPPDVPAPPPIDPAQITFLPPDGWPAERLAPSRRLVAESSHV